MQKATVVSVDEHGTSGSSGTLENNVYASGEPVSLLLDPVDGCDHYKDLNFKLIGLNRPLYKKLF